MSVLNILAGKNVREILHPRRIEKDNLGDSFVNVIKKGDPLASHERTIDTTGASNTASCILRRLYELLFPDIERTFGCGLLIGSAVGYYVQYLLSQTYSNIVCEKPVLMEFKTSSGKTKKISSAIDVFIKHPTKPEESIVIDIKTTTKTLEKWYDDLPNGGYPNQINWYMGMEKVLRGYLVVISYSNPHLPIEDCIGVVEFAFDPEMFKRDFENFVKLFEYIDNKGFPKEEDIKEFAVSKMDCAYCPATAICPKFQKIVDQYLVKWGYIKSNFNEDEQYVLNAYTRNYPEWFKRRQTRLIEYDFNLPMYNLDKDKQLNEFMKRLRALTHPEENKESKKEVAK